MFFCEFWKIFKNTYLAEDLRRAASNDMIITRFFRKIYSSLKWSKECKDNCFLKISMCLVSVFNVSKDYDRKKISYRVPRISHGIVGCWCLLYFTCCGIALKIELSCKFPAEFCNLRTIRWTIHRTPIPREQ